MNEHVLPFIEGIPGDACGLDLCSCELLIQLLN